MQKENPQPQISIREIDLNNSKTLSQVEEIEDAILDQQDTVVLWVDNPDFTLGADSDNRLAGVIQVATDGHVNYLVHPDFQGMGVATQLLQQAITIASERKLRGLVATVEPNSVSQHMLEKQGFTLVSSEGGRNILAKKIN